MPSKSSETTIVMHHLVDLPDPRRGATIDEIRVATRLSEEAVTRAISLLSTKGDVKQVSVGSGHTRAFRFRMTLPQDAISGPDDNLLIEEDTTPPALPSPPVEPTSARARARARAEAIVAALVDVAALDARLEALRDTLRAVDPDRHRTFEPAHEAIRARRRAAFDAAVMALEEALTHDPS